MSGGRGRDATVCNEKSIRQRVPVTTKVVIVKYRVRSVAGAGAALQPAWLLCSYIIPNTSTYTSINYNKVSVAQKLSGGLKLGVAASKSIYDKMEYNSGDNIIYAIHVR